MHFQRAWIWEKEEELLDITMKPTESDHSLIYKKINRRNTNYDKSNNDPKSTANIWPLKAALNHHINHGNSRRERKRKQERA